MLTVLRSREQNYTKSYFKIIFVELCVFDIFQKFSDVDGIVFHRHVRDVHMKDKHAQDAKDRDKNVQACQCVVGIAHEGQGTVRKTTNGHEGKTRRHANNGPDFGRVPQRSNAGQEIGFKRADRHTTQEITNVRPTDPMVSPQNHDTTQQTHRERHAAQADVDPP